MTDLGGSAVTVTVSEDEGQFFFSLDHGASRAGPFDTEEAATDAASDLIADAYAEMMRKALFGDTK